jgi:hypothetical protein
MAAPAPTISREPLTRPRAPFSIRPVNRLALVATLALLSFTTAARAFIGESPAQLDARFGQPVKITRYLLPKFVGQQRVYSAQGMTITVLCMNGTSHRETYSKNNRWTDAQISNFTKANARGSQIQVLSATPTRVQWIFGGNLYASYTNRGTGGFLTVSTADLARAEGMRTREEWFWRY